MNMVPVNKLCRNLGGDISTPPSWAGMTPYLLADEQVLVMSSEDIRCFFYLFEVPVSWHPFMAFNKPVPQHVVGDGVDEPHYLASRVLPMGFLNSVSVAQHVHRRIARMSLHGLQPSLGPQCELRKDRPFTVAQWVYRIYLDNFDALEQMDPLMAARVRGEVSVEVLALRGGYQHWGLPRHPTKAVQQETIAEIQGAVVDGVTGMVKPKPNKVLKYAELAWSLLQDGRASQKQLQIVCGGLVYCSMFRRPLLRMLNKMWSFVVGLSSEPPVVRKELPQSVRFELCRFLCALPLAQMNLRTPVLGGVTASDASETGGGFCVSRGLTPMGVHAAQCSVRGDMPELEDFVQVLTVGLFDGVGALRVAADVLQLPTGGHISAEVSVEGSRVLESNFPDTVAVGDMAGISKNMVLGWALKFSNAGVVLVGGGPPCQGVSGLNSDRKGALKDARSKLFVHVRRVYELCKKHFRWAQAHYFMESDFSMDAKDRATMSADIGVTPYLVDAAGISICRRPRLYWLSWELRWAESVQISDGTGVGWEFYRVITLDSVVDPADYLCQGWSLPGNAPLPTFTTARPRAQPGNRPAGLWQCQSWELERWKQDDHRYPPMSTATSIASSTVWETGVSLTLRGRKQQWGSQSGIQLLAFQKANKRELTIVMYAILSLATHGMCPLLLGCWRSCLHHWGLQSCVQYTMWCWEPPRAPTRPCRDTSDGCPCALCATRKRRLRNASLARNSSTLCQSRAKICSSRPLAWALWNSTVAGFRTQQIVAVESGTKWERLLRLSSERSTCWWRVFRCAAHPHWEFLYVPTEQLTRKLVNFISVKGEDLLLQASTENTVRSHRLRSSVPSRWWRWRTIWW